MHSRCLFGFAFLITACGSDGSDRAPVFGYVEGRFWSGAELSAPVALGSRATIRFWNTELEGARVSSSNPGVASFELTERCLCVEEVSAKHGATTSDCDARQVWDCFDDIDVSTHGVGDAKLLLEAANLDDISANIQVRDVATASFEFVDESFTSRTVGAITLNQAELGLLTLRLHDAGGAELFSGEGPSWMVTDPTRLSLTGRGEAGPITDHPVEATEVYAVGTRSGETTVSATFAGLERTLLVRVH
jgi:hypothetical protein